GGARTHTERSAVAHYRAPNDRECLAQIRQYVARLPRAGGGEHQGEPPRARPSEQLYHLLPNDHRMSYDMHAVLECLLDEGRLDEFQPDLAKEMICGPARIEGRRGGVRA